MTEEPQPMVGLFEIVGMFRLLCLSLEPNPLVGTDAQPWLVKRVFMVELLEGGQQRVLEMPVTSTSGIAAMNAYFVALGTGMGTLTIPTPGRIGDGVWYSRVDLEHRLHGVDPADYQTTYLPDGFLVSVISRSV